MAFLWKVQQDGYENTYILVHNGYKKVFHPMKEIPTLKQQKGKLVWKSVTIVSSDW